jgi:hypothetical protein
MQIQQNGNGFLSWNKPENVIQQDEKIRVAGIIACRKQR